MRKAVALAAAALAALVLVIRAARSGDDVTAGVWAAGRAAAWDRRWLDWGLSGWGRAPGQPIAFSHRVHAGDYRIDCLYCHSAARISPVASIPSVQTCMGCHKKVAEKAPEVEKVKGYWDREEPIPWARVHKLPEFTRFTHKRHVRAGVACQTCHGRVERMERIEQVASLKMGWCISCHEQRGATKDCLACHH